ncbi:MAG: hypothetical protein Q7V05_03690 [Methanoregula sp.]|nr:hypothetical protein [Methanoregula sp.]
MQIHCHAHIAGDPGMMVIAAGIVSQVMINSSDYFKDFAFS